MAMEMDSNAVMSAPALQPVATEGTSDTKNHGNKDVVQSNEAAPLALPTVYLCRHAEPTSKIWDKATSKTKLYPLVLDPKLTTRGERQCQATAEYLSKRLPKVDISAALASPLSRALDTTKLVFGPLVKPMLRIAAVPELQALGSGANRTRMDLADLEMTYGKVSTISSPPNVSVPDDQPSYTVVDLARVADGSNDPEHKERGSATDPGGKYSEGSRNVEFVKGYLDQISKTLPQPVSIAVITHSSVLSHWIAAVKA